MDNIRFNKLQKRALIICGIFIAGMIFGYISGRYRFHEFRILYHFLWMSNYILVLFSFVCGILNAIFVSKENYNWKTKLLWGSISLLPVLSFIIMIAFVILS
ncbi:hypothetical protein SAMN06265346_110132 [Flavobacterium hercynium]|uniref:Uncharacterized protein n=1 Tax=Flavobacterium hercynium TaxID=387094 RepID=A0A226HDG9_9FLAO|nr:hypothetical protein B0A66_11100 [Flavobacterium hercynium]SMP27534.1 hypothetical protein SAMN06265346_110132 [Flavobacterium hercynium]